ncbi:MAG: glycosyltransferase [Thermoleophilia bacterium]
MRVLFLQRQPCIRTLKYAVALRGSRPEITLGFAYQGSTLSRRYGSGDDLFAGWWQLPVAEPERALSAVVAEFRPDVIHSHNLPDALTVAALDVVDGRIPVIHDCHDMQSLRATPYEDGLADVVDDDPLGLESAAVEGCAALVAVSREMLDEIEARHALPEHVLLFGNYALARDLAPFPRIGRDPGPLRVVYQGSLSLNGGHYDLRDHFAALAGAGLRVDVFPNRDAPGYRDLAERTPGLRIMDTLEPRALLRALTGYDVGWAGFNAALNGPHLDTALPNKAFEYLASGLPIAAGPHRALRRIIEDHGVGVVVERPEDLPRAVERAGGLRALREAAVARRRLFTVEAHIRGLVGLYAAVCGRAEASPAGAATTEVAI